MRTGLKRGGSMVEAQWIFCNNHDNWRLQSLTGQDELKMCWVTQGLQIFPGLGRCYMEGECKLEKMSCMNRSSFILMYRPVNFPACHVKRLIAETSVFCLNLEWQITGVILSELLLLQDFKSVDMTNACFFGKADQIHGNWLTNISILT